MKTLSTFILLFAFMAMSAVPVSKNDAAVTAVNFFKHQYGRFYKTIPAVTIAEEKTLSFNNVTTMYVFKFSGQGFVILSADNRAFPVIGYSLTESIDLNNLPVAMVEWCEGLSKQILQIMNEPAEKNAVNPLWAKFSTEEKEVSDDVLKSVGPLCTTKWGQGNPYYIYCPYNPGYHQYCVTGCVATAMGQLMKYWNYPEQGIGTHSFYWDSLYTVNYDETTYRWTEMSNTANNTSKYSIAELLYHCGVAVDMNYGINESGTLSQFVPDAMKSHFNYHPSIRHFYRGSYNDTTWDVLIRDNLDMLHPVIYCGSGPQGGHAFVCDGYQDTCFYHMNWGWDGSSNGYFFYNDLTPGGYDFTYDQSAIVNIFPYFGDYCRPGRTITEMHRYIDDGSANSKYWNNTNCDWLVKPLDNGYISLQFDYFETEANKDILYVYDGADDTAPLIGQYSGSSTPPPFTTSGPEFFLRFVTDSVNQREGWQISYVATGVETMSYNNESFSIFPNPSNDLVTISGNVQISAISISSISGNVVLTKKYSGETSVTIKEPSLSQGIYFVKIFTEKGVSVKKVVFVK